MQNSSYLIQNSSISIQIATELRRHLRQGLCFIIKSTFFNKKSRIFPLKTDLAFPDDVVGEVQREVVCRAAMAPVVGTFVPVRTLRTEVLLVVHAGVAGVTPMQQVLRGHSPVATCPHLPPLHIPLDVPLDLWERHRKEVFVRIQLVVVPQRDRNVRHARIGRAGGTVSGTVRRLDDRADVSILPAEFIILIQNSSFLMHNFLFLIQIFSFLIQNS